MHHQTAVSQANGHSKSTRIAPQADFPTAWKVFVKAFPLREIYIVTPNWVTARAVAQIVLGTEREHLDISMCSPNYVLKPTFETYAVKFDNESRFQGYIRVS